MKIIRLKNHNFYEIVNEKLGDGRNEGMKKKRHEKILELIARYPIDTQEELLRLLREAGFDVTQATVSRDIKELRLLKTLSPDGKYRYAPAKEETKENSAKFYSLFADSAVVGRLRTEYRLRQMSDRHGERGLCCDGYNPTGTT